MQEWIILMLIGAVAICVIILVSPETKELIPQLPTEVKVELPALEIPKESFEWISGLVQGITEGFTGVCEGFKESAEGTVDKVVTSTEGIVDKVTETVEGVTEDMKETVTGSVDKITETIEELPKTAVKGVLEGIGEAVLGAGKFIVDSITPEYEYTQEEWAQKVKEQWGFA